MFLQTLLGIGKSRILVGECENDRPPEILKSEPDLGDAIWLTNLGRAKNREIVLLEDTEDTEAGFILHLDEGVKMVS
jgi:hypothetical protein